MSFEIRSGETLSHAVGRVGRKELRKARKALSRRGLGGADASESAHDLRVSTKKVRALTRLVRPETGKKAGKQARRANDRLGACADLLAALRDADAAVRVFEGVRATLPARLRPVLEPARSALAERLRHETLELDRTRALGRLVRGLRREQGRVAGWIPDASGWKAVGAGLERDYRRARRAMHHAYREPNGDNFHAWRRAVKAHRYQVRLLAPVSPDELGPRADALAALAQVLGDEHDLTMLRRTLRANRFWFGDEAEAYREVLSRIDQQRRGKWAEAQPLGERLFDERPPAFALRMRALYRAFRRGPRPVVATAA